MQDMKVHLEKLRLQIAECESSGTWRLMLRNASWLGGSQTTTRCSLPSSSARLQMARSPPHERPRCHDAIGGRTGDTRSALTFWLELRYELCVVPYLDRCAVEVFFCLLDRVLIVNAFDHDGMRSRLWPGADTVQIK